MMSSQMCAWRRIGIVVVLAAGMGPTLAQATNRGEDAAQESTIVVSSILSTPVVDAADRNPAFTRLTGMADIFVKAIEGYLGSGVRVSESTGTGVEVASTRTARGLLPQDVDMMAKRAFVLKDLNESFSKLEGKAQLLFPEWFVEVDGQAFEPAGGSLTPEGNDLVWATRVHLVFSDADGGPKELGETHLAAVTRALETAVERTEAISKGLSRQQISTKSKSGKHSKVVAVHRGVPKVLRRGSGGRSRSPQHERHK